MTTASRITTTASRFVTNAVGFVTAATRIVTLPVGIVANLAVADVQSGTKMPARTVLNILVAEKSVYF